MKKTKLKFLYDEKNKRRGVLLTIKDFNIIIENLEDYYDYRFIAQRKATTRGAASLEEVKKRLLRN